MDPAYVIEQAMIARQKPMNDAIELGNSPVQQFYKDTTIFLTGGSGFVGKQLLEKLLRSCDIKKVYLLLRSKKGCNIQQRLDSIISDPLYGPLRKKQPNFPEKLVPVEGDVAEIRLGLSDKDWTLLTSEWSHDFRTLALDCNWDTRLDDDDEEINKLINNCVVNVIFHVAATVNFDEPLKVATLINVRGTREALALARECRHFKCFNHTSTAFAHTTQGRINKDVEEKFYQSPINPEAMIRMVETVDEDRLNSITANFIEDWPNTYTFTKAIAEELIREAADTLPVCIVKPPVVVTTYIEPVPGWIDFKACFSNPIGGVLACGLGILHVILVNKKNIVSYAPVDYVNNAIIAASWDVTEKRKDGNTEPPIYTVSSSGYNTQWKFFGESLRSDEFRRMVTPKIVWYCFAFETANNFVYFLLTWLLHYIPGYAADAIVDFLGVRPKGIPPLTKIYTRIYKLTMRYQYFTFNFWNIRDDNLRAMIQRMSPEDRLIYNCDLSTVDLKEQVKVWCVGVRRLPRCVGKHIKLWVPAVMNINADVIGKSVPSNILTTGLTYFVKDNLEGADYGYKKMQYLKYANIAAGVAYGYLIYLFCYMIYIIGATVIRFLLNSLQ